MLDRRRFLKLLGSSPILALFWGRPAEARSGLRRVVLAETFIAGFYYHEGMRPEVFRTLSMGQELILLREPENPHDNRAIAVCTIGGTKIGYIPRRLNKVPAAIADQGVRISAEIVAIDPIAPAWERVRVRVWEEV